MGTIDLALLVEDLDPQSGAVARRAATELVGASCARALGTLEQCAWSGTGDVVDAIAPGAAHGPRKIGVSLDGGASYDFRMYSQQPVVTYEDPITLGESGSGSASVLGTAPIARQSAQRIALADALYGAKGTVRTQSGDLPLPGSVLPRYEGIGRTSLGLLGVGDSFYRYEFRTASGIADQLVDIDTNRDYVLHALDEILALLPAEVDPQDAQYVLDSSDFGVLGGAETIAVGARGGNPGVAFDNVQSPVLLGSTYEEETGSLFDRADFVGGDTHHGAPEGGRLTDIVCVGSDNGLDNAQDTCVVSFYVDSQHGGCHVWQASGRLLQIGQSIGVHGQWFDRVESQLYIATDSGIYQRTADLSAQTDYKPLGTMHRRCAKVVVDTSFTGGHLGRVAYALASGNQAGQNGVMRYDGGTGAGLVGGWTMLYPNDRLIDLCVLNGILYCLASDNRTVVIYVDPAAPTAPRYLPVAGGAAAAIGLDPLVVTGTISGIAVRTALGSAGLYLIFANPLGMAPIGAGLSIRNDQTGLDEAVQVNRVRWHNPLGTDFTVNGGLPCQLLAATNRGLFIKGNAQAGDWQAAGGQNNLGDLNLLFVADDGPYTPGHGEEPCWPVYAANESSLYVSYDGALHWVDVFSKPLDAGPAFYDLYWAKNGVFPPHVPAELGYAGRSIFRTLDGLAHWAYAAVNQAGTSVGGAARTDSVAQISTPSGVPEGQSSRQLLDLDARFLSRAGRPQTLVTVESRFTDPDSPLRRLRETHLVHVDATLEQCVAGQGTQRFVHVVGDYSVLRHAWRIDDGAPNVVHTTTTLGAILRSDGQDPAKATADSMYIVTREQLYKKSGRR